MQSFAAAALTFCLLLGGGAPPQEIAREQVEVPILFFHHVDEDVSSKGVVTPEKLEEVCSFLEDEGYETVSFSDLIAFTEGRDKLPEKPVMITFDDGYSSNLEIAAPILKDHDQRGTVFVIGVSVGKDTYKDTDIPIIPHFGWKEALEWSKVIDIGSHTYDMHQSAQTDGDQWRLGVLPKEGEDASLHYSLFLSDVRRSMLEIEMHLGAPPVAFAYPYGKHSAETEEILKQAGFQVTVLTSTGKNNIIAHDPDSLYGLHRMEIYEETLKTDILHYLETGVCQREESRDNTPESLMEPLDEAT